MERNAATLCLASLNIGGLPSSLPPLKARAAEFCRRLEESDVDVLNLQEVWTRRQLALLRAKLPSFEWAAWRPGIAGQPAGGLATFSRIPVRSVSFTSFRGARPRSGGPLFRALLGLNSRLQGVLTVELTVPSAVVGNVHLTANRDGDWSADNRHFALQRAQLTMLHDVLRGAHPELTILSGDFNVASSGPLYPLVVDGGRWHDPFAPADPATFHAELLPPGRSAQRIDYLLVAADAARYPVTDTALLLDEPVELPGGRAFMSDHVALRACVALPA
jgi:exonuclease III